jgi:nicotinamidase/pyrazinamidase
VLGLATDYCVKETALDGVALGFDTTVIREGIRAVNLEPGDGQRALEQMSEAGARLE